MNGVFAATSEWINKTSMTSLRSLVLTMLFAFAVIWFARVGANLMNDRTASTVVPNAAVAVRAAYQTIESSRHNTGKSVIDGLLQVFVLALGLAVAGGYGDRTSSREHLEGKAKIEEAKERGRISGTAAAAVAAQVVADAKNGSTKEHAVPEGGV